MSLDDATDLVKQQSLTRDAFLGGRLTLSQPRTGFRAGLDSVLLGAAVASSSESLLDLGAGVGTAALVALAMHPGRTALLAELDPAMAALARTNSAENGFAESATVAEIDVTAPGRARVSAGLAADSFASVIANPPFFDSATGNVPGPDRRAARHMPPAQLDLWLRTAATSAAPGGEVIVIYPAQGLSLLLAAVEARFGAVTVLPLTPRDGEPATRILVRGIKGSRAPLRLLASRPLHEPEGRAFRPEFHAIFRGEARLDW